MSIRTFKAEDLSLQSGAEVSFTEFVESDGVTSANIKLVARTDSVVSTWMGGMVHDLSGMFHKLRIVLDWCHDSDEQIGYLDKFNVLSDRIECSGRVISAEPGDRASRILKLAKAGTPYESSIFFGGQGIEAEDIPEEKEVQVNGKTFTGPGIVFRKWPMRGVALCPYGRDNATSATFQMKDSECSVTVLDNEREEIMADNDKNSEATTEALEEATEVLDAATEALSAANKPYVPTGEDFIKAYGSDGAMAFAEGKTFEEAGAIHTTKLEERVKELEGIVKALKENSGGDEELDEDSTDGEDSAFAKRVRELTPQVGSKGIASFAAGTKLPNTKK